MYLFVDPTTKKIKLEFWNREGVLGNYQYPADKNLSDNFLSWIDEFLDAHVTHKEDLRGLVVVKGPGSFTTLRVVISTLNALAYALNIPILGVRKGEGFSQTMVGKLLKERQFKSPVTPYYKEPPKITKPK